jgi:hypothetical protein
MVCEINGNDLICGKTRYFVFVDVLAHRVLQLPMAMERDGPQLASHVV